MFPNEKPGLSATRFLFSRETLEKRLAKIFPERQSIVEVVIGGSTGP